jgi:hypothetical protein
VTSAQAVVIATSLIASFSIIGQPLSALAGPRGWSKVVALACLTVNGNAVGDEELRGLLAEPAMNGAGLWPQHNQVLGYMPRAYLPGFGGA